MLLGIVTWYIEKHEMRVFMIGFKKCFSVFSMYIVIYEANKIIRVKIIFNFFFFKLSIKLSFHKSE